MYILYPQAHNTPWMDCVNCKLQTMTLINRCFPTNNAAYIETGAMKNVINIAIAPNTKKIKKYKNFPIACTCIHINMHDTNNSTEIETKQWYAVRCGKKEEQKRSNERNRKCAKYYKTIFFFCF